MYGNKKHSPYGNDYRAVVHLICLAMTIAAGVSVQMLIIQPCTRLQELTRLKSERLDRLLDTASSTEQKHTQLKQAISDLTRQQEQLLERIPAEPQESNYLAFVTETANSVDLTIRNYQPGTVTANAKYSEMAVQISAEGSYEAICQFMNRLEHARRLSRIERMNIVSKIDSRPYPVEMSIVLYFGLGGKIEKGGQHG